VSFGRTVALIRRQTKCGIPHRKKSKPSKADFIVSDHPNRTHCTDELRGSSDGELLIHPTLRLCSTKQREPLNDDFAKLIYARGRGNFQTNCRVFPRLPRNILGQLRSRSEMQMSQAAREIAVNAPIHAPIERDEITAHVDRSWDELFGMGRHEIEAFQLTSARRRLDELAPTVQMLKAQADDAGVTRLETLEDIVPLLFPDAMYKSYPLSLIEKNRYDLLTEWLDKFTSLDLSAIDVGNVASIDGWMDQLEAQSQLQIYHTTGSSGKLSFFPRSTLESELWFETVVKAYAGFSSEPGVQLGRGGVRMPVVLPSWRNGRQVAQRNLRYFEMYVAPSPDQIYTMTSGTISAELISLSGRIRLAQAKGELAQMKLSDPQRLALKRYLEELERRPDESSAFFRRIADELAGQRIYLQCSQYLMYESAAAGLERGIHHLFAPDSVGASGGGAKGRELPQNWAEVISEFTGVQHWGRRYGMTELIGPMVRCPHGHFHIPPYYIPFQLDPETGAALPRHGVVTGRFAFLDLLAQTHWGGIISGDRVTIEWDTDCACGRKGAFIHDDVVRYSEIVTGEDKLTCATTIDNTDSALKLLIDI
jgi:hypothetical protein